MSWFRRSVEPRLRSAGATAVAGLAAVLFLGYAADVLLEQLRRNAASTFNFRPAAIVSALVPLFVVGAILALAWLVLQKLPPSRFAAVAFIVAGLLVIAEYLSFLVGLPLWLRTTILGRFRYAMMDFGPQSSTYYLASACVVIGIAAWRRSTRQSGTSSVP